MSTLDERLMATASRRALEMHATEWHKSGMEEPVLRAAVFKHAELHGIDALAANEIANAVAKIKRDENPASWPAPWDWEAVASRSVAPPQFAIPSLLPYGYVSLLAGHGGDGKSAMAEHAGVCLALARHFAGLPILRQHRVTYLGCEDRFNEFYYRLLSILEYLNGVRGPDEKEIKLTDLDGWFDPIILVGRDSILWERDPKTGNCITPAYLRLCERMRASGTEILIVDGVADTFGGNINSPAEVKRYMNSMLAPVNEDRGAVLLIAHVGHRRE